MVTLGGVKASPSIVIASHSPINPISEKLWYTVIVLQKVYRYRRLSIASLSLAFNKHPSDRPNIRITMGDSNCYIRGPNKKSKNEQTQLKYAEIQEPSDLVCKLQLQ